MLLSLLASGGSVYGIKDSKALQMQLLFTAKSVLKFIHGHVSGDLVS